MARIYMDVCCLKRPFDDQAQPRIRLESEAVLALLSAPAGTLEFIRGVAHELENDQNPLPQRAALVRAWLATLPPPLPAGDALRARTSELMIIGFRNFDALYIACAELATADVFCSCDDRLLARARNQPSSLKLRALNPTKLTQEVFR